MYRIPCGSCILLNKTYPKHYWEPTEPPLKRFVEIVLVEKLHSNPSLVNCYNTNIICSSYLFAWQIFLDPKARNDTEYKLETLSGVYRKLSGKDVVFEYPMNEA